MRLFLLFSYFLILPLLQAAQAPPCTIVIFGASGDLATRKLFPALQELEEKGVLAKDTYIIGTSRSPPIQNIDLKNYLFLPLEFDTNAGYEQLEHLLSTIEKEHDTQGNRLYYFATPPVFFPVIAKQLKNHHLIYETETPLHWSRVIIEKPFGSDLSSALHLQMELEKNLKESQMFRIDHYLGKLGVQKLIAFRQSALFEPLWNNNTIDHVQITLSEEIGIGTRASFWEMTGALRDLLQNHLMQLLTLTAMDLPMEKINILKAIRPFPKDEIDAWVVRGQYGPGLIQGKNVCGYREELGVSPLSFVETYVGAKIMIDTPRWSGVPFYLRAGKRLSQRRAEIAIFFKNKQTLLIRIQPSPAIFLDGKEITVPLPSEWLSEEYEQLLFDCLKGNKQLFVEVEEPLLAWELLTPVLTHWSQHPPLSFPNYIAGSEGPPEADWLLEREGHKWRSLK